MQHAPEIPALVGYDAAVEGLAFRDRSERLRLSIRGRAPEQVLLGLVSGKIPPLPSVAEDRRTGRAEGSALLTAKGRMIAVLRLLRAGPAQEDGFLMDVPASCRDAAAEHLRKFVPPRLATVRDESGETGMLSVLGPRAAEWLAAHAGFADVSLLDTLADGDLVQRAHEGDALTVIRTTEVASPAFDVLAPAAVIGGVRDALTAAGAPPLSLDAWDTLRIEAGAPEFGVDMDDTTIPVEAGIHGRVVDYQKGCFTGQEVLIRIRDRGHVNRHLRGLRFGRTPPPASGSELFLPGGERAVGHVTSSASSPRLGEVIGLGYVRREVVPPAELRLGSPDGPPLSLRSLESGWLPGAGSR